MKTSASLACSLLLLVGFLAEPSRAQEARALLQKGLDDLKATQPESAADAFAEAAELAPDQGLDPAVPLFNQGLALHAGGDLTGAREAFEKSLQSENRHIQSRSYFNLGTIELEQARAQAEAQQLDPALEEAKRALRSFRNALTLDPADTDAKFNFEYTQRLKQLIEELKEAQPPQSGDGDQQQDSSEKDENEGEPQPQEGDQQQSRDQGSDDPSQSAQQPQGPDPSQPQDGGEPNPAESGDEQEPREDGEGEQPQPMPLPEEMTQEEAEMVLRALQQDEQAYRDQLRIRLGRPEAVENDW